MFLYKFYRENEDDMFTLATWTRTQSVVPPKNQQEYKKVFFRFFFFQSVVVIDLFVKFN